MATLAQALVVPVRTAARTQPFLWRQRSLGAVFGLVLVVIATVVAVLASSLIGPFIMFAIPLLMILGFAMGPLHALIKGEI